MVSTVFFFYRLKICQLCLEKTESFRFIFVNLIGGNEKIIKDFFWKTIMVCVIHHGKMNHDFDWVYTNIP